ncbi:MAG TPA: ParB/RepB/Spo0J family partition protein [Anaerolineae bacterium]|nr:ParB/RepB/Spo0J family partition protein [Anaerolineae bacterium]MCB9107794.1 ParB/RepB/Spo0J family partition protein [Anaerolineales bacterium]HRV90865.1 ParB/RepB/Spo0J family partition protein [Anaerolineae bacterium]
MTKRRGLGKGLSALIPHSDDSDAELSAGALEIPVDQIAPNPHQPRQEFDEIQLRELADSINEHGLIQPLIVTQVGLSYQLIAGERRWRASQLAGLETVPVIVKETTPQQMLELALVENIQRADLNPLEEARAYAQLMEEFGLTQEAVAERVSKSRTAVANTVRLLNLNDETKAALASGTITEGHARALLSLKSDRDQLRALATIIEKSLTVRQTEALVKQMLSGDQPAKPKRPPLTPHDKAMLEKFESRLGTRVELSRAEEETGKLTIHFYSEEELQAIFNAILGNDAQL